MPYVSVDVTLKKWSMTIFKKDLNVRSPSPSVVVVDFHFASSKSDQSTYLLKSNIVFRKEALQLPVSKSRNEFVTGALH